MGFFSKVKSGLKQGLAKTVSVLNTDVRDLFKAEGRLVDDAFCDDLFEVLVKTDMGVAAAQESVDQVKKSFAVVWSSAVRSSTWSKKSSSR